jgi:23S rRNA (uridine2552-2'-O)-methyltransferase
MVVSSSRGWFTSHVLDPFVKQSKLDGFRARSAYKLLFIQEKYKILQKDSIVLDCGSSPGSWAQVASRIATNGKILAIDLLPIEPFQLQEVQGHVQTLQLDLTSPQIKMYLESFLRSDPKFCSHFDVILSDMAPNMSGIRHIDSIRSIHLAETALEYALEYIHPSNKNGRYLAKILMGGAEQDFLRRIRQHFHKVDIVKPPASKVQSSEMYILARNKK